MEIDANLLRRNARSNSILDKLKASARNTSERNLIDRVLRPYVHILNECEIRGVQPLQVNEATVALIVTMVTELLVRTIPKQNPTMIGNATADMLQDFSESLARSISHNFNVKIQIGETAHVRPN